MCKSHELFVPSVLFLLRPPSRCEKAISSASLRGVDRTLVHVLPPPQPQMVDETL